MGHVRMLDAVGMAGEGGPFTPRRLAFIPIVFFLVVPGLLLSSTLVPVPSFHVCLSSLTLNMYNFSGRNNSLQQSEPRDDPAGRVHVVEDVSYAPLGTETQTDQGMKKSIQYAIGMVQEQIHGLRSPARNRTCQGDACGHMCEGKGIFVYDLPAKFNRQLMKGCVDILPWMNFCEYITHQGMGQPVPKLGRGWYKTNQFSLEPIFHSRIMKHPCRVLEEDKASLFYIPFYAGLNVLQKNFQNASVEEKDQLGLQLVEWLKSKRSWIQNEGKDHFLALGTLSWDFRRTRGVWGSNFLELKEMQNPVKLIIERQPWHSNDVGIPYPTNFHPKTDKEISRFQSKLSRTKRRIHVSFAGAGRPNLTDNVRSFLIEECANNSSLCTYLDCKSGSCINPKTVIKLFMESEFCLQPPGDSPTRKSFFDSLVYGCIPVIFDPFTAYYQYPWHLPEDHTLYSVYINQEEVKQGKVKVLTALQSISAKQRKEMRRYIISELMPQIVYANPNSNLHRFRDAFMISVDNLINRAV
ncbi:probable xyloglucan galactosyltransferase GT20 [Nymphaea colorata]|uniref:Exostosin GT47 domain-containing protein n=1 Tax=Nymphaea colorata TaxID=210225 RepID=A0A5K1H2U6_9MAGN|nr:probable xyloglucan galactosyltransferase GT20 [Nymphaea colorata]